MATETTFPHLDLLSENNIAVTDLSEKTQKLITKFNATTDEDTKEALDEKIFGDVGDYIEEQAKEKRAKEKKEAHAAAKQKQEDAAKKKIEDAAKKKKEDDEKEKAKAAATTTESATPASKTKKVDLSKAPTAAGKEKGEETPKEEGGFMRRHFRK